MKNLILVLLACITFSTLAQDNSNELYGVDFQPNQIISVNEMEKRMVKTDSLFGDFQGVIESSCKMKGCWMTVKGNSDETYRITFKDYGFFVPKEGLNGKQATFNGYCIRSTTSVAELKHYAEDAGQSAEEIAKIITPKNEFSFVAYGVKIED